jgi:D-serine deaminase-like pyridoxal phosphate-dependent protein
VATVKPVAGASVLAADGVDTPALLVDLDRLDGNIARIAGACREHGIAWRPHVKGIKTPAIVDRLLAAGASGVTCAKLGEAEVMADAGVGDILIANQIVGPQKIARLMALRARVDVAVAVDDASNVAELAAAARRRGVKLRAVIETDIGIRRAGVTSPEACLALARRIAAEDGLCFAGVMGWEGHAAAMTDRNEKAAAVAAAVRELVAGAERCRAAGLPVAIVSCGGTGTYWLSAAQPGVTEIQAGGGVLSDVHYQVDFGVDHPCALTVVSTVTSRPNPRRIVCDAGFKTMSRDVSLPRPLGLAQVASVRLSAEHATIELAADSDMPRPGERLEFEVGYSDSTVPLHDLVHAVRDKRLEATWPILGRGKLQ